MNRSGIPAGITPGTVERMVAMRRTGKTLRFIAAAVGISEKGVRYHLARRAGLPADLPPCVTERIADSPPPTFAPVRPPYQPMRDVLWRDAMKRVEEWRSYKSLYGD